MNRRTIPVLMLVALFTGLALAPAARADREDDLKASFKKRHPQLNDAKDAGKIGETYEGYVEAVKSEYASDSTIKSLIDDENKDRKEIFKIIADRQKTTVEKVAKLRGEQNFKNAKTGWYLKGEDGNWKKK